MKYLHALPALLLANVGAYLIGLVWPPEEPIGVLLLIVGTALAIVNAIRLWRVVVTWLA